MTDEVSLLEKALFEYKKAKRLRIKNQELLEHLIGSVYYIIKYAESHNVHLSKNDRLLQMINEADRILSDYVDPTNFDKNNNRQQLYRIRIR